MFAHHVHEQPVVAGEIEERSPCAVDPQRPAGSPVVRALGEASPPPFVPPACCVLVTHLGHPDAAAVLAPWFNGPRGSRPTRAVMRARAPADFAARRGPWPMYHPDEHRPSFALRLDCRYGPRPRRKRV